MGNNPVRFIDPLGLTYIDINITGGTGAWGGSAGIQIGPDGLFVYAGGGYGAGASVTGNSGSPSGGFSASETVSGGTGGWGGLATVSNGSDGVSGSIGAGWGVGMGFSAGGTYTYPIWTPNPGTLPCH